MDKCSLVSNVATSNESTKKVETLEKLKKGREPKGVSFGGHRVCFIYVGPPHKRQINVNSFFFKADLYCTQP